MVYNHLDREVTPFMTLQPGEAIGLVCDFTTVLLRVDFSCANMCSPLSQPGLLGSEEHMNESLMTFRAGPSTVSVWYFPVSLLLDLLKRHHLYNDDVERFVASDWRRQREAVETGMHNLIASAVSNAGDTSVASQLGRSLNKLQKKLGRAALRLPGRLLNPLDTLESMRSKTTADRLLSKPKTDAHEHITSLSSATVAAIPDESEGDSPTSPAARRRRQRNTAMRGPTQTDLETQMDAEFSNPLRPSFVRTIVSGADSLRTGDSDTVEILNTVSGASGLRPEQRGASFGDNTVLRQSSNSLR